MRKIEEFRDEISVVFRGTKLIDEFLGHGYLVLKFVISSLRIITPYISIYYSSEIITALTQKSELFQIIKYALVSVCSTLILDIISRIANRKCLIMLNSCWFKHEALLSRKALSLDYGQAESVAVSALRTKVSENSRSNGAGVVRLAECLGTIVSNILSIAIAIAMISRAFFTHLNNTLKLVNFPILSAILVCLAILFIFLTVKANNQNSKIVFDAHNYVNQVEPILDYYTNKVLNENKFGKDIRIFNEKNLILEEIERTAIKPLKESRNVIFNSNVKYGLVPVISSTLLGCLVYIYVGLKALAGVFGAGKVVEYYGATTKLLTSISSLASEFG